MKKLFLVLGRTSSGKTSITRKVAEQLGLKVLKSYTTRPMRANEIIEKSDHIFIDESDMETYKDKIAAYTEINDYKYFSTIEQIENNDFYVIDTIGYNELKNAELDIELVTIYITVPLSTRKERAKKRGDSKEVLEAREFDENEQFSIFEKDRAADYYILNDGNINESVDRMKRIVGKELNA